MDIDPDKLEALGTALIAIATRAESSDWGAEVDFGRTAVGQWYNEADNACGTVACHAGWLAVAIREDGRLAAQTPTADDGHVWQEVNWRTGARRLSGYLGFPQTMDGNIGMADGIHSFSQWADENPALWGNEHGRYMFASTGESAFGAEFDDVTLTNIGQWYLDVADRVREAAL